MDLGVFFLQTPLDQGFLPAIASRQIYRNRSDDTQMVSLIPQYLICLHTEEFHSEIKYGNTYK